MISDFISNLGSTGWIALGVFLFICEITLFTVAGTGFGYFVATGLGAFIIGVLYKIGLFGISTNLGFVMLTWAILSLLSVISFKQNLLIDSQKIREKI